MPPLEQFMEVSFEEQRNLLYRDMERGDIVIGRINSIRDFGFFVTLICMAGGLERDIEDLELTALCPLRDVPSNGNHDDPLSRSVRVAIDNTETYERVLEDTIGYSNPSNVEYLLGKIGISDTQPPSLMRGLQSKHFLEEDFATIIRKKQSASWALKCYANKGSLLKAITDFELALESCPTHRNAKKYLCQTLVERGGQLEKEQKLVTAEGLYRKALALKDSFPDAKEALRKIELLIQKSLKLREEAAAKEAEKVKNVEMSAEKLRKILKEEKRMKKKRTISSSTSLSSTSSSDHSSSWCRKSKTKKRKHRRSSQGEKRKRKVLSRDDRSVSEEWYPAPPNTTTSFLDQKCSLVRLFEGPERTEEHSQPHSKGRHRSHHSLSLVSTDAPDNSRGRFEDDPVDSSPQRAESSKGKGVRDDKTSDEEVNEREASRGHWKSQGQADQSIPQEVLSSLEKAKHRRMSSSASSEHSCKSDWYANDLTSQSHISSYRRSDSGRYGSTEQGDVKNKATRRSDGRDNRYSTDASLNGKGSAGGNKELSTNLLDIFSQIAQFEKEKYFQAEKVNSAFSRCFNHLIS
ncbi:tetratricopeptide repeat protein 14-like [Salvelinus fontinalis]|uniref:tetratricopeptide repeat protein 14-like n=1 Tax=Salvelinus fontinalis TaxID=8038 RepID=UPI0024850CF2|nr:tetratricopeptide repeat protein 14-like [Salvelinus fontinalis]